MNGLREIDTQLDVEADFKGSVLLQLDSAVDAMRGICMQLMHARDNKFHGGIDNLMAPSPRRSLAGAYSATCRSVALFW
ncbi:MAG: hypothetical protein V4550_18170 [Gemmatimonadota bacterium]